MLKTQKARLDLINIINRLEAAFENCEKSH